MSRSTSSSSEPVLGTRTTADHPPSTGKTRIDGIAADRR